MQSFGKVGNKLIRIYSIALDEIDPITLQSRLDPAFLAAWRERHEGMQNPSAARASLAGVWLAAQALPQASLSYSNLGKPILTDADQTDRPVSISHTKTHAFCAVSDPCDGVTALGIDAEPLDRRSFDACKRLAARWFSPAEQADLDRAPSVQRFLEIWTRKEALVKLTGTGLRDLRSTDSQNLPKNLHLASVSLDSSILSIAYESDVGVSWGFSWETF